MKRRQFNAEFKEKVPLEAIGEDLTIAELANKHSVGSTQIKEWKSALLDNAKSVFEKGTGKPVEDTNELVATLERKVGQQAIQIDFLKKNLLKFPGKID